MWPSLGGQGRYKLALKIKDKLACNASRKNLVEHKEFKVEAYDVFGHKRQMTCVTNEKTISSNQAEITIEWKQNITIFISSILAYANS